MKLRSAVISLTILASFWLPAAMARASEVAEAVLSIPARLPQLPLIGDRAPEFEARSTAGPINFPKDYLGKWVVLFSHPGDFTPVCTSEFVVFSSLAGEFEKLGAQLLGLSVDPLDRHQAWARVIEEQVSYRGIARQSVAFPIIEDADMEIAWMFGMLHPTASNSKTVRATFLIDPRGIIRALLYYPFEAGRNVSEIKRLLIALQTADAHGVATGADWQPGDDVFVSPKAAKADPSLSCNPAFFCLRSLPRSELKLP